MSVWKMWTTCDRCGFEYKRYCMSIEKTGSVVCQSCYDGAFDAVRHPQNYPAAARRELKPVPGARPQDGVS